LACESAYKPSTNQILAYSALFSTCEKLAEISRHHHFYRSQSTRTFYLSRLSSQRTNGHVFWQHGGKQ
jgi:hypothetical protein